MINEKHHDLTAGIILFLYMDFSIFVILTAWTNTAPKLIIISAIVGGFIGLFYMFCKNITKLYDTRITQ